MLIKNIDANADRIGDWCASYDGTRYWPLDPRVEDVTIEMIAHSLSNQCRYGGRASTFYSVAQHCLYVSRTCDPQDALWGLLHDASEAFILDIPRPIKYSVVFDEYRLLEKKWDLVIAAKFNLSPEMPASVHIADKNVLAAECKVLMGDPEWARGAGPVVVDVTPWPPAVAYHMFMDRFKALTSESK